MRAITLGTVAPRNRHKQPIYEFSRKLARLQHQNGQFTYERNIHILEWMFDFNIYDFKRKGNDSATLWEPEEREFQSSHVLVRLIETKNSGESKKNTGRRC